MSYFANIFRSTVFYAATFFISTSFLFSSSYTIKNGSLTLTPQNVWQTLQAVNSPGPQPILPQTFGQTGTRAGTQYIPFSINTAGNNNASAIALDTQGRLVVAGFNSSGGDERMLVARFLPTGQLDTSFGQVGTKAGTQYIPFSIGGTANEGGTCLALDSQGRIIIGGADGISSQKFIIARFLSTGQLDTTFGQVGTAQAGTQYIPFSIAGGAINTGTSLAIDSQDRIILGGYSQEGVGAFRFAVARFLPTGHLDTTFGQTGIKAGTQYIPFGIAQGGGGSLATCLKLDSQGRILLGGYSTGGYGTNQFALARFLPTGQLDLTFGQVGTAKAGTQYIPFAISESTLGTGTDDQATSIDIDSQGRILLGGYSADETNFAHFAMARFLPTGALDTTFGQTGTKAGTQYIPFNIAGEGTEDKANGLALDSQQRIILGGYSLDATPTYYFAVARFLPTGKLDTTFGQTGIKAGTQYIPFTISGTGTNDQAMGITLDSQNSIFLAGFSGAQERFSVAKFITNYTLADYQAEYPTDGGFY